MYTVARARGGVMLRSRFTVITTPRAVAGAVKRGATATPRQARLGEARGVDDVSGRLRHNSQAFDDFLASKVPTHSARQLADKS